MERVIPGLTGNPEEDRWIPAFAGMTVYIAFTKPRMG